jgi:curved DNA-binding protein CbpA
MTAYFDNPGTLEELKKQYHRLAMLHHPDRGGNVAVMQEINEKYAILFETLKNCHADKEGKIYTAQQETTETPNEFIHIITILLNCEGLIIEIIGRFVWLTGNTFEHKQIIKELGFRWSHNKTAWYISPEGYRKKSRKQYELDEIREAFGVSYHAYGKGNQSLVG